MRYQIKRTQDSANDYHWDVIDTKTNKVVLADESYQVADNVCLHLNYPDGWNDSEAREIANSILRRAE